MYSYTLLVIAVGTLLVGTILVFVTFVPITNYIRDKILSYVFSNMKSVYTLQ